VTAVPDELLRALAGGVLIGFAGILLLLTDGKIAGVSGIMGDLLRSDGRSNDWRVAFLAGLAAGGFALHLAGVAVFMPLENRSFGALIAAGLLVGFGTQLGSGCTSGHGVCGLGRFSGRSLAATLTFMATGALTVYLVEHALRGGL